MNELFQLCSQIQSSNRDQEMVVDYDDDFESFGIETKPASDRDERSRDRDTFSSDRYRERRGGDRRYYSGRENDSVVLAGGRDFNRDRRRGEGDRRTQDGFYTRGYSKRAGLRSRDHEDRENAHKGVRREFVDHKAMRTTRPSPTNDTLIVENIPHEFCKPDAIKEFFVRFGTLTNIKLDPRYSKATITYSSPHEAQSCYNSPEVIFNNRFVKVYWLREDLQPSAHKLTAEEQAEKQKRDADARKEFLRKLAEKKQAIVDGRAALIERQLAEQKRIFARLEDPSITMEEKRQLMNNMNLLTESLKSMMASTAKPTHIGHHQTLVPSNRPLAADNSADSAMDDELQDDVLFKIILVCTNYSNACNCIYSRIQRSRIVERPGLIAR